MRTFRRRSKYLMLTIWKSLVQSKLDYCSQLWSPSDQGSISRLESNAKNFTSQVGGIEGLDYSESLVMLNMYSQERRRERYKIIFIWRVSQQLVKGTIYLSITTPGVAPWWTFLPLFVDVRQR